MIRQAISCDICGTDMRQAHHWFVAFDQGGELRISGWNTRARLRKGAKHLCGQTCLHKLVDEFMARTVAARVPVADEVDTATSPKLNPAAQKQADRSLTPGASRSEVSKNAPIILDPYVNAGESSARILPQRELPRSAIVSATPQPPQRSDVWRTSAWKREQERAANQSGNDRKRSIA